MIGYGGKVAVAVLSEWLRSLTRNQMGSARTGSNPVDRVLLNRAHLPVPCIFYSLGAQAECPAESLQIRS